MAPDAEDHHHDGTMPVWMSMSLQDTERLSEQLLDRRGSRSAVALRELLWLRAILIEQQRRMPAIERARFGRRADGILTALAAGLETKSLSAAATNVRRHERP
jgi:hypothetical protein